MFCENCGAELQQKDNKLVCPKCGAEFDLSAPEAAGSETPPSAQSSANAAQPAAETASEYITPRGFSSKKNIIIIILAAVLVLGLGAGITVLAVTNSPSYKVSQGIELAERYLSEQNYEQAIIEYEKVLEIEPMNVDAYLGLAEAYKKMGEIDKAIEILRKGYDLTDDKKIKKKLDGLTDPLKMPRGFEWVLEPTYEYDDVVILRSIFGNFEKYVTLYDDYEGQSNNSIEVGGLYTTDKGDKEGLADNSGNEILEPQFSSICNDAGTLSLDGNYSLDTHYNLVPYSNGHGLDNAVVLFNYYDKNYYQLELVYDYGTYYQVSESNIGTTIVLGAYFVPDGSGFLGELDENGNHIYDKAEEMINEILNNNTYGYGLYANGKLVVPTEFDTPSIDVFNDRFVGNSTKDKCVFKKNNKIYIYDLNGKCLSYGVYDNVANCAQEEVYFDGHLTVCRDGKWGLIDENCKEVVKCQFEDISAVYEGNAWVKLNGKWGVIKITD